VFRHAYPAHRPRIDERSGLPEVYALAVWSLRPPTRWRRFLRAARLRATRQSAGSQVDGLLCLTRRLRFRSRKRVEKRGGVLAPVAGEVAVVAVDHRQAGAHEAGEVEGGDASP
jgi:hypothetical protein